MKLNLKCKILFKLLWKLKDFLEAILNKDIKEVEIKNPEIIYHMKKTKKEIVKAMLKEHMSIDKIIKFTGLTKEEIEKMKLEY